VRSEDEPADLRAVAVGVADTRVAAVAQEVRAGDDRVSLDRHERPPLDDPGVDDRLLRFALELAHQHVDRDGDAGDDGADVGVHERGQLLAVGTSKGTNVDRLHGLTSSNDT
jgi:hypothetical protein